LTTDVTALWSRVLQAVPASRLLLKYLGFYGDDVMRARFTALFAGHGIGAERLIFVGDEATRARHLDILSRVDIALDPFPFNGCTTSFEALWMGVPVITLAGRRFVGRMGASFLTQIGLTDLIATTPDEYVAKATRLANDPKQLAALRSSLRARVSASPLCDSKGYARSVETAYRDMWRQWCAKHATSGGSY
jgi:predicted O-linked N-acetylglucosamine transferase (SPINDLY family)